MDPTEGGEKERETDEMEGSREEEGEREREEDEPKRVRGGDRNGTKR